MENNNSNEIVKKTAQFCETIFNSQSFKDLFIGDFDEDEKIYNQVGGCVMRYINATKNFDVNIVYAVLKNIKDSDFLKQIEDVDFEDTLFSKFFAPEILKNIKKQNSNIIEGIADICVNLEKNYILTNSFNGFYVDKVKSDGLDYSKDDPFVKEYETLMFLGCTPWEKKGIYFADPSKVTMYFCNRSPEKFYEGPLKRSIKIKRKENEDLEHYLWRRYNKKRDIYLSLRDSVQSLRYEYYMKNQDSIEQAVSTLIDAYKNEKAGIAFISYNDFYKLNNNEEYNISDIEIRNLYISLITKKTKYLMENKKNTQTEDDIINKVITHSIKQCDHGGDVWGICLKNGKVPPEIIAVAEIPQSGLLSLNKQKTMNNENNAQQNGPEMGI